MENNFSSINLIQNKISFKNDNKVYAFDPSPIAIECLKLGCVYNNIRNRDYFLNQFRTID
jgi:hypothetical protein